MGANEPKGRQSKSKARLSNYDKLLSEENRQQEEKIELYIPPGPRLGTNVIEAKEFPKPLEISYCMKT